MKAAIQLIKGEIKTLQYQKDNNPPNLYDSPQIDRINRVANQQITQEILELNEALTILNQNKK